MPRSNKASRYQDVKAWRVQHPERNRRLNKESCATYRGTPGSPKRIAYNKAQLERAILRNARKAAQKALAKAAAAARIIVAQRRTLGYVGPLKSNSL